MATAKEEFRALKDREGWSWATLADHLDEAGQTALRDWALAEADVSQRASATTGNADAAKPDQTRPITVIS